MQLFQILLPVYDNDGKPLPQELFAAVADELTARFGGATAYSRAPAEGTWKSGGKTHRDDIVVVEVMTDTPETEWWRSYRQELERRFRQEHIVIRMQPVTLV